MAVGEGHLSSTSLGVADELKLRDNLRVAIPAGSGSESGRRMDGGPSEVQVLLKVLVDGGIDDKPLLRGVTAPAEWDTHYMAHIARATIATQHKICFYKPNLLVTVYNLDAP